MLLLVVVALLFTLVLIYLAAFRAVSKASDAKIATRIGLTYGQLLTSISVLYGVRGTRTFRSVFSFSDLFAGSLLTFPPIKCMMSSLFYARFMSTLLFPPVMIAVFLGL